MSPTIKEILEYPSLKQANILCGQDHLSNKVQGTMVMEALDIESWGHSGEMLLTSYFAFEHITPQQLDSFFSKAKQIGISGLIFKKDRLINKIPPLFIEKCQTYKLPLIQVEKNVTYEKIINDILESIINRKAFLLENYYENHQQFIQLMMNQADLHQILSTLKKLIQFPVSLIENIEKDIIGTDEKYHQFKLNAGQESIKKQHMNLDYTQYSVDYMNLEAPSHTLLAVPIPNLSYEEYTLLIHGADHTLSDIHLMTIETTVVAIQIELVKRYALKQSNKTRLNDMAADLVHGRLSSKDDIEETIYHLQLNPSASYRIIRFNFNKHVRTFSFARLNRFIDNLANLSKREFQQLIYITHQKRMILIVSEDNLDLDHIKNKIRHVIENLAEQKEYSENIAYTTMSSKLSVYNLSEGYRQALNTQKVVHLWEETPKIIAYDEIGIYRLFVETGNMDSLEEFIPEKIRQIKQRNPDLLDTLYTFINKSQSYSKTAEILYVHPKTIRYRIDRLKELYAIDFENAEELLNYSIALRILKVLN